MEKNIKKKTIVFSGVNLHEGGPLSIFYDCLNTVKDMALYKEYRIIALVHKTSLFNKFSSFVDIIEFPKARKSYLYRLYYEFYYFKKISKDIDVELWISLHDITPNVSAKKIYTYCHNPSPFLVMNINSLKYGYQYLLFSLFYKYLYGINIKKAEGIIVQQDWMRKEFLKMYPIKNVIVARPRTEIKKAIADHSKKNQKTVFIYPAFPRFFKNFEQICEACRYMKNYEYEVWLTIDGKENKYSSDIYNKYNDIRNIKWIGLQSREAIFKLYEESDCLIFPSKLETWGLPISEYKITGKDILMIDLPYAYETLGTYERVMVFPKDNPIELARMMEQVIEGKQKYIPQMEEVVEEPFVKGWNELVERLVAYEKV